MSNHNDSGGVIRIECKGHTELSINDLNILQGDLKDLSVQNYEKLKKQILELGFSEPVSVWKNDDKWWLLNGTQRLRTLQTMRDEGIHIPKIPVNIVEAKNIKEAKKKILSLTSQFGAMTSDGLYQFMSEGEIQFDEIVDFNFPEISLDDFAKEFGENNFDPGTEDEQGKLDELSPIYCKCPDCGKEFNARETQIKN